MASGPLTIAAQFPNQLEAFHPVRKAIEPFDPRRPILNRRDVDTEVIRDLVHLVAERGSDLRGDLKRVSDIVGQAGDFPLERVNRVRAQEEFVQVNAQDEDADGMNHMVPIMLQWHRIHIALRRARIAWSILALDFAPTF